jgi:polyferredoxin
LAVRLLFIVLATLSSWSSGFAGNLVILSFIRILSGLALLTVVISATFELDLVSSVEI